MGVFPFIHDYMATILQSFKILFFTFSYYFFISLATMIGMVPGDCYFYVCCVNLIFPQKKKIHSSSMYAFMTEADLLFLNLF